MENTSGENAFHKFKKIRRQGNSRRESLRKVQEILGKEQLLDKKRVLPVVPNNTTAGPSCEGLENVSPESDDRLVYSVESSDSDNESFLELDLEEEDMACKFKSGWRLWAVQENVTQKQLRALLQVCNNTLPFRLPGEPSTLLQTTKPKIRVLDGLSKYWHNGVEEGLKYTLQQSKRIPSTASLNISVDGIPIAKSSNAQFWPILANVHEIYDVEPFVIGVYYGKSKDPRANLGL